tara:strand:+ start:1174 stop:1386 length:213 start_codon:yes stop_codon:yes gene_type:complete
MELQSNLLNFNENYIILFVLIMFFLLFSYILLREKIGRGPSINEIIGLSGGSLQDDYKRHYNNKRRRKFF